MLMRLVQYLKLGFTSVKYGQMEAGSKREKKSKKEYKNSKPELFTVLNIRIGAYWHMRPFGLVHC
jgi:hypothetical protein